MIQAETTENLLSDAAQGDRRAWNSLVDRFMPLVYSVMRKLMLQPADAQDVSQIVWLRLLEHLDSIRNPAALPGWLATTTRHEALRALRARQRTSPTDPGAEWWLKIGADEAATDEHLLTAERHQAMREALAELPPANQRLLLLLVTDPPTPYDEISRILNIPIGSIGPTRARCLKKLRTTAPMRALAGKDSVEI